ncbi:MAG: ECF transporter S component [Candidatus Bathyarchaeia archaeon]
MNAKEIALVSVLSALCIVIGYARGIAIPFLPGLVEFMTVIIFVSGFVFGWHVGALNGAVALTIYMLVPYPFAHPGAWLFVISPVLLVVMAGLGALYGFVGGILGKKRGSQSITLKFSLEMAFWGLLLTFIYDVVSSIGFYFAYPAYYMSVWEAIYFTFVPLWLAYPPILHTIVNALIFAFVSPPLIKVIKSLKISIRSDETPK